MPKFKVRARYEALMEVEVEAEDPAEALEQALDIDEGEWDVLDGGFEDPHEAVDEQGNIVSFEDDEDDQEHDVPVDEEK